MGAFKFKIVSYQEWSGDEQEISKHKTFEAAQKIADRANSANHKKYPKGKRNIYRVEAI